MVQADEKELNSLLKEYLQLNTSKASADSAATVRDLKVNLSEDRLRLYLLANFHGKDPTFVLEGKVRSANSYLDFEPVSGVGSNGRCNTIQCLDSTMFPREKQSVWLYSVNT